MMNQYAKIEATGQLTGICNQRAQLMLLPPLLRVTAGIGWRGAQSNGNTLLDCLVAPNMSSML